MNYSIYGDIGQIRNRNQIVKMARYLANRNQICSTSLAKNGKKCLSCNIYYYF